MAAPRPAIADVIVDVEPIRPHPRLDKRSASMAPSGTVSLVRRAKRVVRVNFGKLPLASGFESHPFGASVNQDWRVMGGEEGRRSAR
jgi:hypothetical protein